MINRIGINTQNIPTQPKKTQNVQRQDKPGRVEEIKQKIQNGDYKVDINKTAEAFAKALL
ncbi:flagellar biosynthesis anti-sigma factor FlgM [Nautilia sp.]